MVKYLSSILAGALFSAATYAGALSESNHATRGAEPAAEVARAIEWAEWSLERSSLAPVIDKHVMDNSTRLLERSREELVAGNVRTARELVDRAMAPLAEMRPESMSGRHPDQLNYKEGLRQTLLSLLPEARRIAREKRAADAFVDEAQAAVERSDAMLAAGDHEAARRALAQAYESVLQRVAGLRSGDDFYLAIPQLPEPEQWSDGLRRIEERRIISQYLMIEAEYSGLDIAALESGVRRAEEVVADAERLATQSSWSPALEKLELAYVLYEDSWRSAGVEW